MKCISPFHNQDSPSIKSLTLNLTFWQETGVCCLIDVETIVRKGTIVYNQAVRCNGHSECLYDLDELECGFNALASLFYGNWILVY